jgi:pimeloyl-ACP methyl ester carboxylesterase
VNWIHAGLPSEHLWEALFYLVLMHGTTRVQFFPRVYTPTEFAQIKAPTLLLLGDREKIYPVQEAIRQAKRLMPSIQVQIIPGAHHITALAQPELVNAHLLQFFHQGESHQQLSRIICEGAVSAPTAS